MGDTSGCQISSNNLAVYLQGVTVEPSTNITSEYFVTASLPSSASLRRVWQFTTQGTITGPETATLTLDYTQAHENCPEYNITFEGALNGTLTVKNQVFSANKFMSYTLTSAYVLVLTLRVPKSIQECFGPGTTQNYSFSVFLNDATTSSCGGNSYTITPFTGSAEITITRFPDTISDSDTLYYCVVGGGGAGASSSIVNEYYYGGGGGGGGEVTTGSIQLSSSTEKWTLTVGQDSSGNGNPSSIVNQSGNVIASAAGGQVGGDFQEISNNNGGESGSGVPGGQGGCGDPSSDYSGPGGGGGGNVSGGLPNCTNNTGGDGGAGDLWSCNLVNYGGGGGGGGTVGGTGSGGSGGSGGGGRGGGAVDSTGEAGTSNSGGGGGGGYCEGNAVYSGGNGASGIILLSYDASGYYITA